MKSCVLLVALLFSFAARAEKLALVGATAINPADGKITSDAVIIIDGEKIDSLGQRAATSIPADARLIDCTGKFIIPGLWDMHVHLAGVTADPKWARDSLLPLLIAHGVTGVRDMGGDLEALHRWRQEIDTGKIVGPRIYACGPFLADAKPGTPDTIAVHTPAEGRRAVRQIKARHGDFVKVLTRLGRESFFTIAKEAKAQRIPLAGHVPDSVTAAEASNAGQRSIEHIFYSNLAFDCSSQETELRAQRAAAAEKHDSAALAKIREAAEASFDVKKADALWQTFIRNKTWAVPTLIAIRTIAQERELAAQPDNPLLNFIPPVLRAQWTPEAIAKELSAEVEEWYAARSDFDLKVARSLHAAGVQMMAGSDSLDPFNFPGASLHAELQLLVRAGFTPMEALQAATINPARFLEEDQAGGYGAIAPGRAADLVILEANPLDDISNTEKISAVITRGRLLERAELDRMLAQARAAVARD